MCSLEMSLLQNVNANDKVFIFADTRHTQRWSERRVDPMLCKGDLEIFCNCLETLKICVSAHTSIVPGVPRNVVDVETIKNVDVLGVIAEDQHLTRCAQVCFTGKEEDVAEQRDQGTIDEVRGDQDMEEVGDALEEADREADLLEQISLLGHPESEKRTCLASWLRLPLRNHTVTSKPATSTGRSTRSNVTCCPSSTRSHQCRQDFPMPGMRQRNAETSQTHKVSPPRP